MDDPETDKSFDRATLAIQAGTPPPRGDEAPRACERPSQAEAEAWLRQWHQFWSASLDRLEALIAEEQERAE